MGMRPGTAGVMSTGAKVLIGVAVAAALLCLCTGVLFSSCARSGSSYYPTPYTSPTRYTSTPTPRYTKTVRPVPKSTKKTLVTPRSTKRK